MRETEIKPSPLGLWGCASSHFHPPWANPMIIMWLKVYILYVVVVTTVNQIGVKNAFKMMQNECNQVSFLVLLV